MSPESMNPFDPREETPVRDYPPRKVKMGKRPWHRQGWVWMIVMLIALVTVVMAIGELSGQVANVEDSIRQQTEELERQNYVLGTLVQGLDRIESAITNGIDRIIDAIDRESASS